MLAIVIPYFKIDFFKETLESLAAQTNKQFHVYIGDDASPNPPIELLKRFQDQFSYTYHRFESNLGGTSLVQQWNRCLQMVKNEPWVQILGDDDALTPNVVAAFYHNLPGITNQNSSVIRFATQVINANSEPISEVYQHPKIELANDFLLRKFKGGTRSSLSEYIFDYSILQKIGLVDLPLAWYSDLLAVVQCSWHFSIFSINNAAVCFRWSNCNITAQNHNLIIKERAYLAFLFALLKSVNCSKELQEMIHLKIQKSINNDKKNLKRIGQYIWFLLRTNQIKTLFLFLLMYFKAFLK